MWETIQKVLTGIDTAGDLAEGAEVSKNTTTIAGGMDRMQKARHLEGMRPQGPQSLFGPYSLATGLDDLINGDSVMEQIGGGLDVISGGIETVGLAGALTGSESLVGAAAAGGPVAAIVGALATGISIGNHGNDVARERGFLGKNRHGENANWSDRWGEIAFNPMTAHNAGPALVAAGAGAFGSAMYDFGQTIGAVPRPMLDDDMKQQLAAAFAAQQKQMDGDSQTTFDAMTKTGMPEAAAETLAAEHNPHFHELREQQRAAAALRKSGLPEAAVQALSRGQVE